MIVRIATVAMLGAALSAPMMAQTSAADNYKAKCAMCHGADGSGKAAMKIEPFSAKTSDADSAAAIKNGKAGAGPVKMTGYAGKLSDAEITALVKYVKTLAK
jgi:cytochrome c553